MPDTYDDYDEPEIETADEPLRRVNLSRRALRERRRAYLDELAIGWGIEPAEHPNKESLIEAILQAADPPDIQPSPDETDAPTKDVSAAEEQPPETPKPAATKQPPAVSLLQHRGRWLVKEPVRYLSVDGEEKRAEPWASNEGGMLRDRHGKPLPNVISDIPEDVARAAYERDGALQPLME